MIHNCNCQNPEKIEVSNTVESVISEIEGTWCEVSRYYVSRDSLVDVDRADWHNAYHFGYDPMTFSGYSIRENWAGGGDAIRGSYNLPISISGDTISVFASGNETISSDVFSEIEFYVVRMSEDTLIIATSGRYEWDIHRYLVRLNNFDAFTNK